GAERAAGCKTDEVNLVASVSETHNQKNVRQTVGESFSNFQDIASFLAGTGININGTLATAFGCPFEGSIDEDKVMILIDKYHHLGLNAASFEWESKSGSQCPIDVDKVMLLIDKYLELGAAGITLADTTGMATPKQVYQQA